MSSENNHAFPSRDILVVDDTVANLQLLADILNGAGYRTRPASDGELALRSAQVKPPALILLDVKMPDMDGFEVCRRLKAIDTTRDIPVIFLSALTETTDKTHGFAIGAVDYITKPFHAEEVLARIGLHLALSAAREQLARQNVELQQAKEQLEEIYRSVGNGIVTADAGQQIVLFNAAAERMFGYSAVDMIGQPLSVLLPQRFRTPHEGHVRQFGAGGQSARTMGKYGMIYALRASGEEFPIEATVSHSGGAGSKLFTVILNDITERRQSEQEREKLMRQLELLSERLATAQEDERRKIAYELHEEVAQELASLKIYLEMQGRGGDSAQTSPRNAAIETAVRVTERVRRLAVNINPSELEDFGLPAAARSYCKRQAEAGGWTMHLDAPPLDPRPARAIERACFRVLQEALTNVLEHAQANEVWVHLHQRADELELGIRDDGIGFDSTPERAKPHPEGIGLGLFGIQIRAKQVGGSVKIESTPGVGTKIDAVFPSTVAT